MREIRKDEREVNGVTKQDGSGVIYWMGTRVEPCPMCGIAVTNVDHCGEFGNPECPVWGIGKEEYERRFNLQSKEDRGHE